MTLNEQVPTFPQASVAVQVTVVVPTGNELPDGGLQVATRPDEQLSVTLTFQFATTELLQVVNVMSLGQQSEGATVSTTVTSCVQVLVLLQQSTACQMPR